MTTSAGYAWLLLAVYRIIRALVKRSSLFIAAGIGLLVASKSFSGGAEVTPVELHGLAACYASPASVWFSVTNRSRLQLNITVSVDMRFGETWRETHPSLTGGYKFGRKTIRMLPFAPDQTLDLSVEPFLRPPEDSRAAEPLRPNLMRVRVEILTPTSERMNMASDMIRLAPAGGCE